MADALQKNRKIPPHRILRRLARLCLSALRRPFFLTDISPTLEGVVSAILREESISSRHRGRRKLDEVVIVAGGILGRDGDIVVDSVSDPRHIYGVANGEGDLKHALSDTDACRVAILEEKMKKRKAHSVKDTNEP